MRAQAVLFDKDGTLFDFQKTWAGWIGDEIERDAAGDAVLARQIADAVGFDLETRLIRADSPAIAGTSRDVAALMLPFRDGHDVDSLTLHLDERAAHVEPVAVLDLPIFLDGLLDMGLRLGVATNDSEVSAHRQLNRFDIVSRFDYVAGYDSGHGAKPAPGMCLAFAHHTEIAPDQVVMVGDSLHDLDAGRAAGMQTVAVLSGVASREDLQGHADIVLPDIGHLAAWISG